MQDLDSTHQIQGTDLQTWSSNTLMPREASQVIIHLSTETCWPTFSKNVVSKLNTQHPTHPSTMVWLSTRLSLIVTKPCLCYLEHGLPKQSKCCYKPKSKWQQCNCQTCHGNAKSKVSKTCYIIMTAASYNQKQIKQQVNKVGKVDQMHHGQLYKRPAQKCNFILMCYHSVLPRGDI